MARSLLTGSLPQGIGIGAVMAVIAARDVLKKWTETRIDQAVRSIDIVVGDWKRENDVTGLDAVAIDTIDVLCILECDHEIVPALKDLSLRERIAVAILNEAVERPHVATKGGAVLAAYTIGTMEGIGKMYTEEWLPHIWRGVKVLRGASKAHAEVHGTVEEKNQRWADQCAAYDCALKTTRYKTQAKSKAAVQCGVAIRTIERALKKRRESNI